MSSVHICSLGLSQACLTLTAGNNNGQSARHFGRASRQGLLSTTQPNMANAHPLVSRADLSITLDADTRLLQFPVVQPLCEKYPDQAAALFQAYVDLSLGALDSPSNSWGHDVFTPADAVRLFFEPSGHVLRLARHCSAQAWTELRPVDLESARTAIIIGRPPAASVSAAHPAIGPS